jgi:hypothetical protein
VGRTRPVTPVKAECIAMRRHRAGRAVTMARCRTGSAPRALAAQAADPDEREWTNVERPPTVPGRFLGRQRCEEISRGRAADRNGR